MEQAPIFDMGRVFSDSFRILARQGPLFFAMTVTVLSPVLVVMLLLRRYFVATQNPPQFVPGDDLDEIQAAMLDFYANMGIFNGSVTGLETMLTPVAAAFIVLGTFRSLRGREFSAAESLSEGLQHLIPLAAFGFMYLLGLTFGILLCCLPGLFLAVAWIVASPAMVVESLGPIAGMRRSWNLVRPRFWWCVLTGFLLWLVVAAPAIAIGFVSTVLDPTPTLIVMWTVRVITVTFTAITSCVLYDELRRVSPGDSVDEYAEIFA